MNHRPLPISNGRAWRWGIALMLSSFWLSLPSQAYPPAPGFTVYGMVRDEFGWAVASPEARIVFKNAANGKVIADSRIGDTGSLIENYRLMLPLDHHRTGSVYREEAVTTATGFTIEVIIEGVRYFPVPIMAPTSSETQAAEFLHLDLMLGHDSDDDGLPDLWEQWQLEAAGHDTARLDWLTPDGDPDADGMSNLSEYIAGTFAFLGYDSLSLDILSVSADRWSRLEFLAIIDKTYTLERSADLKSWEPAPFGLWESRGPLRTDWTAPDTVVQRIQAQPGTTASPWYYRLRVQ